MKAINPMGTTKKVAGGTVGSDMMRMTCKNVKVGGYQKRLMDGPYGGKKKA